MSSLRHDKRATVDRMRTAESEARDELDAVFADKRPTRRAVRAAEAFLAKRDPWDEIKPR